MVLHWLQVMAGSSKKVAPAKADGSQQPVKEAATEAAAGAEAEDAIKGSQQRDEGSGKGTKRPAGEGASREAHAASSLRLAPNAKRQKTDAEWGMVVRTDGDKVAGPCADMCRLYMRALQ